MTLAAYGLGKLHPALFIWRTISKAVGGLSFKCAFTYIRSVRVTCHLELEEAKIVAQSLNGPTALVYGCMPPGGRLTHKGPGFISARTYWTQAVTERFSAVREYDETYIVGAAKTTGRIPGTGKLAAVVHMQYTSPTLSCKRMTDTNEMPEWKLEHFQPGKSPAYRVAAERHVRQKLEIERQGLNREVQRRFNAAVQNHQVNPADSVSRWLHHMVIESPSITERLFAASASRFDRSA